METFWDSQAGALYERAQKIIKTKRENDNSKFSIPEKFKQKFFNFVDIINLSLMEDQDNFYGYFLFQMSREVRFDISSPTAVNFKGAKYVIYFNPIIFLTLNRKQMASTIKHEILHIVALHLMRAREFRGRYKTLAVTMAMDIVVNQYINDLPPYAATLERINYHYSLELLPFKPFEYYVENIQTALDLAQADKEAGDDNEEETDEHNQEEKIETEYNLQRAHDIWEEQSDIEEKALQEFTEKFVNDSQKGSMPKYLESMISSLKNSKGELPWNLYLKRLMGTVESNRKKAVTRRNRRQPERLDLRGELRSHKAKIAVALDISGSISDEEFNQAIQEVLNIVKNYNHEITIIECDSEIRRVYKVKALEDIKERLNTRGGTRFTPVFEYANNKKINLLIYFTDGQGEEKLRSTPKGYKTLWVLSGKGEKLSVRDAYGTVKKLKNIEINEDSVTMSDVRTDGYSMLDQERIPT